MIPFLPLDSQGVTPAVVRIRAAAFVLWVGAIHAFSAMPGVIRSKVDVYASDKTIHLAAFFICAFLLYRWAVCWRWPAPGEHGRRALMVIAAVSLIAVIDEVHQTMVPGRVGDVQDWVADTSGAVVLAVMVCINSLAARWNASSGSRPQPAGAVNKIVARACAPTSE